MINDATPDLSYDQEEVERAQGAYSQWDWNMDTVYGPSRVLNAVEWKDDHSNNM